LQYDFDVITRTYISHKCQSSFASEHDFQQLIKNWIIKNWLIHFAAIFASKYWIGPVQFLADCLNSDLMTCLNTDMQSLFNIIYAAVYVVMFWLWFCLCFIEDGWR